MHLGTGVRGSVRGRAHEPPPQTMSMPGPATVAANLAAASANTGDVPDAER